MRLIKEFKKWMKATYKMRIDKAKDLRDKVDSKIREAESEFDDDMDWI